MSFVGLCVLYFQVMLTLHVLGQRKCHIGSITINQINQSILISHLPLIACSKLIQITVNMTLGKLLILNMTTINLNLGINLFATKKLKTWNNIPNHIKNSRTFKLF